MNSKSYSRSEIRRAIEYIRRISQEKYASGDQYRLNRRNASEYLKYSPKWSARIHKYFAALRAAGERVVFVDVCGKATGTCFGADVSYSFSLRASGRSSSCLKRRVRVEGDIFSAKDFYSFVQLLERIGDNPAFVTFEPVAGLKNYAPIGITDLPVLHRQVMYQRLENNLRKMIGALKAGGYIYLDFPFRQISGYLPDFLEKLSQDQYQFSLRITALCKELDCTVSIETDNCTGPHCLVHKRKNASRKHPKHRP